MPSSNAWLHRESGPTQLNNFTVETGYDSCHPVIVDPIIANFIGRALSRCVFAWLLLKSFIACFDLQFRVDLISVCLLIFYFSLTEKWPEASHLRHPIQFQYSVKNKKITSIWPDLIENKLSITWSHDCHISQNSTESKFLTKKLKKWPCRLHQMKNFKYC